MKKLLILLLLPLLVAGCTNNNTSSSDTKVNELEQKIIELQAQQATTPTSSLPAITTTPSSNTANLKSIQNTNKATSKPPENPQSVAITPSPTKSNDQICQDSYGLNSIWSGNTNNTENIICYCKDGYGWNEQRTSCVTSPVKSDDSLLKIAKCDAEKTESAQTFQRVEDAAKQMMYTNTLTRLDATDPCGQAFTPDAIQVCYNGHATLARNTAIQSYNDMHNKNLITIQNRYIECLNQ